MGEKSYQLKDQESGFVDPETHFEVTRDQVVKIDTSKGAGKATLRAIAKGGLIEVNRSSKAAKDDDSKSSGKVDSDLPADFPTRKKLIDAGYDSVAKVKAASDEDLLKVVSQKTVDHIREVSK